ncbi:MAG: bifunctional (p)ppGpp synthetase/guanosine-3',5'-bis(diphosphate) 3'-pyrophosphohydrolase [Chloroflexota bacterium]
MVSISATIYPKHLEELLAIVQDMSDTDKDLIARAYYYAENAHTGQIRKSGEPYFTHPVAVAAIIAELQLDAETIAAGLLHDVIEDIKTITYADLASEFGTTIANLVDGVTKLTKLPIDQIGLKSDKNATASKVNREMEYFRKMIFAMDSDVRVILVKLADRLHNMRTLEHMPPHKQQRIAQETMQLFAPLANRLGIWQIKWELEDLSFRYINPDKYRHIARKLDERRQDREIYVANVTDVIRSELEDAGIHNAIISGRPKHIYSIHKKMQRKEVDVDKIYDIRAIRIIVEKKSQCYIVLGIIHDLYMPIPGEFDDYVAAPKESSYQSLHTAVLDHQGKTIEVQIRTHEMHEQAEYGIAAHWRYKEGPKSRDKKLEERIAFLRRSMDIHFGDEDAESFMNRMLAEALKERVYVFTPRADIIDLPIGSTPIDFAYAVHTEIGHRCRGAKIHGKLKPLNYQLKTGDQVDIIVENRGGPSMDWLNEDLGYTKTSRARSKIRHWFRKQNRDQHITLGRAALEREMKRLGVVDKMSFETVANLLNYNKLEDFLAAIGAGDISSSQIAGRVLEDERKRADDFAIKQKQIPVRARPVKRADTSNGVQIAGASGMLTNLGNCCNPVVGDDIIGYVTRGRGVTIHRTDCNNLANIKDTERLIDVGWGEENTEHTYIVPVEIIAQDREGLLHDITKLIKEEHVNIASVAVKTQQQIATLNVSLEIANNRQLSRILIQIEAIESIYEARRINQHM